MPSGTRKPLKSTEKQSKETLELVRFIGRCYDRGVISHGQWKALEGVSFRTDPRRVLKILTRDW